MRCSSCHEDKVCSDFYKNRASKSTGYHNQCKVCQNISRVQWVKAHPETATAGQRRRTKNQKVLGWPNQRAYSAALGKDGRRRKYVRWKYGDRAVEVDRATICAICGGTPELRSIDHCHDCSEVRGMLCRKCNAAMGLLGDSTELLLKAVAYLKAHECAKERDHGTAG